MSKLLRQHRNLSLALKILALLLLLGFILRLFLPTLALHYAENKINQIPGYHATINDVTLRIYRGSYALNGVAINKIQKIPVPYFTAQAIEFSIDWPSLLKGKLVAHLILRKPVINFVLDPKGQNEQLTISAQWSDMIRALFPMYFNKITVINGTIHLRSFTSSPPYDLFIKNIQASANNLQNTDHSNAKLPAVIMVTGQSMDGAPLALDIDFNPFMHTPTFDLDASIENLNIKAANNFLQHYTKIKVASGYFSLYVEAAAANGKVVGYAKPMFRDLRVLKPVQASQNPIKAAYRGAVQAVTNVLKNPKQQTVATKIAIKGNIDDPNISIWSLVINLLRHAFIQALLPRIDNSIQFQNIDINSQLALSHNTQLTQTPPPA